jgi:hypothetical protein
MEINTPQSGSEAPISSPIAPEREKLNFIKNTFIHLFEDLNKNWGKLNSDSKLISLKEANDTITKVHKEYTLLKSQISCDQYCEEIILVEQTLDKTKAEYNELMTRYKREEIDENATKIKIIFENLKLPASDYSLLCHQSIDEFENELSRWQEKLAAYQNKGVEGEELVNIDATHKQRVESLLEALKKIEMEYAKSSDLGNPRAQYLLAQTLEKASILSACLQIPPTDTKISPIIPDEKIINLYLNSAKNGHHFAQVRVIEIQKNFKKAILDDNDILKMKTSIDADHLNLKDGTSKPILESLRYILVEQHKILLKNYRHDEAAALQNNINDINKKIATFEKLQVLAAKKITKWFKKHSHLDRVNLHKQAQEKSLLGTKSVPLHIESNFSIELAANLLDNWDREVKVDLKMTNSLIALAEAQLKKGEGDIDPKEILNSEKDLDIVMKKFNELFKDKSSVEMINFLKLLKDERVQLNTAVWVIDHMNEVLNDELIFTVVKDDKDQVQAISFWYEVGEEHTVFIDELLSAPHNLTKISDSQNTKRVEGAATALVEDAIFRSYKRKRLPGGGFKPEELRTGVILSPLGSSIPYYEKLGFITHPDPHFMILQGQPLRRFLKTRGGRAAH